MLTEAKVDFSHGLLFVYDKEASGQTPDFTSAHHDQGFARLDSVVGLRTLVPWGVAQMRVFNTAFVSTASYDRVISVPLYLPSGMVHVDAPVLEGVSFSLQPGHYRLVIAQKFIKDEIPPDPGEEDIDLFFEKMDTPITASEIIVRDAELTADNVLESADVFKM